MRCPLLFVVLGSLLTACTQSSAEEGRTQKMMSAVEMVDAPALMGRIRASKARLVYLNAWATWCQPCVEEFPELVRFQRAHTPPEAELLFVTTDFGTERDKAEAFLRKSGALLPSYMKQGGDMEFIDGLSKRWSGALPATFLFGRDGQLLELWQGKVSFETLEKSLIEHGGTP